MSGRRHLSVILKVDKKISKVVLSRTCPTAIEIPFLVYIYSKADGAIIGEAICDDIEDVSNIEYIARQTGFTEDSTRAYLQGSDGYLWRLKEITRYKSYRELSYLGLEKPPHKWRYVE